MRRGGKAENGRLRVALVRPLTLLGHGESQCHSFRSHVPLTQNESPGLTGTF